MTNKLLWALINLPVLAFALESGAAPKPVGSAPVADSSARVIMAKPDSHLKQLDNASAKLAKANRDLQLAKIQQQIDQTTKAAVGADLNLLPKTVVTGVMISGNGKNYATLKFPDGGTLGVEVGSIVKNFRVSEINLSGVKMISECKNRGCRPKTVFYERIYDAPQSIGSNTQTQKGISRPTKLDAEVGDVMVPPIVGN